MPEASPRGRSRTGMSGRTRIAAGWRGRRRTTEVGGPGPGVGAAAVARYGQAEVESWYLGVWERARHRILAGTPEDYDKLYDFACDAVRGLAGHAVRRPCHDRPGARRPRFLRQFLEHACEREELRHRRRGRAADFITLYAQGNSPSWSKATFAWASPRTSKGRRAGHGDCCSSRVSAISHRPQESDPEGWRGLLRPNFPART